MKILGLTGSIATGKSFVALFFRKKQIEVFSSDIEVGNLLKEREVIEQISEVIDLSISIKNHQIDKHNLSKIVFKNESALKKLEEILHPLVEKKMQEFINNNKDKKIILLEIPLLFERGHQSYCNKIITTYCSEKIQIQRALRRKNIDNERLSFIMKKQLPSKIKAQLTDYLVYTDISYDYTEKQLKQILEKELI